MISDTGDNWFRRVLPDICAFGLGLGQAYFFKWNTTDLVWSLWLCSLVTGYLTILSALSGGAATGIRMLRQKEIKRTQCLPAILIGLVVGVVASHPEWPPFWRLLIVTGFLGGLTTFSTFSAETVAFLEEGRLAMAATYSAVSLAGSLALTLLGLYTARALQS